MKVSHHPITAFYGADHDRLDALFNKYREKKQEDATAAKPYFREFFRGLRRHIVWEEDVLFPFFEKASGSALGPTQVMRQEHRMIGEILERMHEKVRVLDPNTNAEEEELISVLKPHNDKEENILYPAIDQCAGPGETAELFLKMEEIPEDRLQACCGSR